MLNYIINPDCTSALKSYELPKNLGFGEHFAPLMLSAKFKDNAWSSFLVEPFGPISLLPSAKVFHYAQEIFEGLKVYKSPSKEALLFRPEQNAKRFKKSAERLAMPILDEKDFLFSLNLMASLLSDVIPETSGQSLYLRPIMIATDTIMSVRPSTEFLYMVLASPCGDYFSSQDIGVLIERDEIRASSKGLGSSKTGANYAASLHSYKKAKDLGLSQTLWLDSKENKYIEELSGMNFFALINNELHTPLLNDSILEGVTREAIIKISRHLKIKVVERKMDIGELIEQIKDQRCSEAFACGTAAVITPLAFLSDLDEKGRRIDYEFRDKNCPLGSKIKDYLLALQEGRISDEFGWVSKVSL
jgi:branched-chain amino acid aminotransferase